ncbi:hypothetical protein CEXT_684301 [Caerostris extrusa]|uniref:Uncharacterized protein n=1 Tax=Caerostris extrusa TaxID=172846 RepID=A0AAV4XDZ6_CAEEX|nr:hypothetical protein CEXT_684301 [Caerostris extrusa]
MSEIKSQNCYKPDEIFEPEKTFTSLSEMRSFLIRVKDTTWRAFIKKQFGTKEAFAPTPLLLILFVSPAPIVMQIKTT